MNGITRRTFFSRFPILPAAIFGLKSAPIRIISAHALPAIPSPVGTWNVETVGAPFPEHLFTFHQDGTMIQVNPDAGNPITSGSDGLGIWTVADGGIQGTFKEINADRTTHEFAGTVVVTFSLHLSNTTFFGSAIATIYNPDGSTQIQRETTLHGTRMRLDRP